MYTGFFFISILSLKFENYFVVTNLLNVQFLLLKIKNLKLGNS